MIRTLADVARDDSRAFLLAVGMVILALCLYAVLFATSHPSLLRLLTLAYLAGTAGVGFWLYITNPALYLGYVWWIWFISPFIRRVIDYSIGAFTPPSMAFVLLAPYVVTGLTVFDLARFGSVFNQRRYFPFLACLLAIFYGFLVGIPRFGFAGSAIGLLNWACPVLLAFFILVRAPAYPKLRRAFRSAFAGGVLFLGAYGVFQFFTAPPWDTLWMTASRMTSIGKPEPMLIRVFGPMDSPGPYAMTLMTGLVLLFDGRGLLARLAVVPGYMGFLLALVRGAWGGWVVAFGYSILRAKGASRGRLAIAAVLVMAVIVPLSMTGEVGDVAGERMASFTSLQDDGSLQARRHMYSTVTIGALLSPLGQGLAAKTFDSGFVTLIYQLGWLGSGLYLYGLFTLMHRVVLQHRPTDDRFATLCAGIAVSFFLLMLMGPQVTEIKGCIFWSCIALVLASRVSNDS